MKKVKLLFQGDSITDAGRDRRNYRDLGNGYPKYAAEYLRAENPEIEFDFIDLGISGNRTSQLFDRVTPDFIDLDPDIISILIGINDIWHRYNWDRIPTSDAQFELNYRSLLTQLKAKTHAKIVIMAPFYLDSEENAFIRDDLVTVGSIVKKLADEFADVYIPLDVHFAEALKSQPAPLHYSDDGVHPNANGAAFIGRIYAEAVKPLLSK